MYEVKPENLRATIKTVITVNLTSVPSHKEIACVYSVNSSKHFIFM